MSAHLTIPTGVDRVQFVRIVNEILLEDASSSMRIADAALYAVTAWESEGLELMCEATGFGEITVRKSARVAAEFPPSVRVAGFGFGHYRRLLPFPRDWSVEFLRNNAGKNLTNRALYALAVEAFGKHPHEKKLPTRCNVALLDSTLARLRPFSGRKIAHFIEGLLEEWLKQHPDVPAPVVPAPVIPAPVVTPAPVVVNEPRPTYAERRKRQLADGAPPIPAKPRKLKKLTKVAWTECKPSEFIDAEAGAVPYKQAGGLATKFYSLEDAIAAEQQNFEKKGYRERVAKCGVCSGGNAPREVFHVYHIFS